MLANLETDAIENVSELNTISSQVGILFIEADSHTTCWDNWIRGLLTASS